MYQVTFPTLCHWYPLFNNYVWKAKNKNNQKINLKPQPKSVLYFSFFKQIVLLAITFLNKSRMFYLSHF